MISSKSITRFIGITNSSLSWLSFPNLLQNTSHIPLTICSVIFFASPNSIMVLSRQNRGLSTPA